MNKTIISAAMALALGTSGAQAVTLTFGNTTTAGINGIDFNYSCNTSDFTAGAEVRICSASGDLAGGLPTNKDTINGGESWSFNNGGQMTGVSGTASTSGVFVTNASYIDAGYLLPTADRDGGAGIDQGGIWFGESFGFLAPYLGSEATTVGSPHPNDTAWGIAQYTATSSTTFEVFFPVLEMQWAGSHFSLGSNGNAGVTFIGTTDGINFSMWAEELIDPEEDRTSCCFAGWSIQWYYTGTIATSVVPVPATIWLFGSGLIGLVGLARRKKSS